MSVNNRKIFIMQYLRRLLLTVGNAEK